MGMKTNGSPRFCWFIWLHYLLWRDIRVQWSLHPAVGACEVMFWCGDMTADIGDTRYWYCPVTGQECGKGSSRTPGAELPPVTAESLIGRVDTAETHGHMVATGSCIRIRATSCYTSQKYPRLSIKKFSTFPAPFLQSGQLWHASQVSTVTRLLALAASLQRNKMKGFGNNIRHLDLTSEPQSADKNSGLN